MSDSNANRDAHAAAQASLNHVLHMLEGMLQDRHQPDDVATVTDIVPANDTPEPVVDEHGQFNIPLLDDVVGAADSAITESLMPGSAMYDIPSELDFDPVLIAEISDRLRNELEVIVQAGLERLTAAATKEIMSDVKAHLDIILPEIIAEACDSLPDDLDEALPDDLAKAEYDPAIGAAAADDIDLPHADDSDPPDDEPAAEA